MNGLSHLRYGGHNVILFHILDDYELNFPLNGMWKFLGLEGEGELVTQPARVRENYLKSLNHLLMRSRAPVQNEVDYVLVNTKDPVEKQYQIICEEPQWQNLDK